MLISEKNQVKNRLRYLTATSLRSFLTCPQQCKLAHVDKLRTAKPIANLAFGTTVHYAVEKFYSESAPPDETFKSVWEMEKDTEYQFSKGDTHKSLLETGAYLMRVFQHHSETPRNPETLEKSRHCEVAGIVPFYGTIDFTGTDGLLLDWKTSGSKYPEYKAEIDLQLTAYAYMLAVTEEMPEKVGFGVFIKKKRAPEVQYVFGKRTALQLHEFENLVVKVWNDVLNEEFHKVSGGHCSWCDFLPICLGQNTEGLYKVMPSRYKEVEIGADN